MIWCDMDGVLTDFVGRTRELFGQSPDEYRENDDAVRLWHDIGEYGYKFWSEMEWLPGAKVLWELVEKQHGMILTSVPWTKEAEAQKGKRMWLEANGIHRWKMVKGAHQKIKHCMSGDLLIDDYDITCKKWLDAGGHVIHHVSVDDTYDILTRYVNEGLE